MNKYDTCSKADSQASYGFVNEMKQWSTRFKKIRFVVLVLMSGFLTSCFGPSGDDLIRNFDKNEAKLEQLIIKFKQDKSTLRVFDNSITDINQNMIIQERNPNSETIRKTGKTWTSEQIDTTRKKWIDYKAIFNKLKLEGMDRGLGIKTGDKKFANKNDIYLKAYSFSSLLTTTYELGYAYLEKKPEITCLGRDLRLDKCSDSQQVSSVTARKTTPYYYPVKGNWYLYSLDW